MSVSRASLAGCTRVLAVAALVVVFAQPSVAEEKAFNYYEAYEAAGIVAVGPAQLVPEQPSIIKIYESTFNDFARAIEPALISGHYTFSITIDAGWFGKHTFTICDSDYTARVSGLDFDITPGSVDVEGDVTVDWCGLSFSSSQLDATGNVYYSSSDKAVRFSFSSANVQPCFTINVDIGWLGFHESFTVCLPLNINIAPTLNIPPVPIGTSIIYFETAGGPRQLYIQPRNVSLIKRGGYVELQSDVSIR